jgi:hypothetical protein
VSLLATVVALAELCAVPEPASARDPEESRAYSDVGDEARATGDLRVAAIAYRNALALDPENAQARAALTAVCRDGDGGDDGAALLDAVARYRAGDRGAARTQLARVARGSGPSASGAHFFLGLLALDAHDVRTAIRELELARMDPEYSELARALLRLARRDGRLAIALLIEPELDTNPQLLPDTPPAGALTGAPASDEALVTAATITGRPRPWLAIRNALTWRNQRRESTLDFVGENLQLAAERAGRRDRIAVRYDLDYDLLDGARYLIAHRAGVGYRRDGRAGAVVASYAVRRRDYARDSERAFTGWVHAGDAGAIVPVGGGATLDARVTAERELTADASFTSSSAGIRLALRTRSTAPVRLTAGAALGYASYDRAQPDGQIRRDVVLQATAELEIDLGDHVVAVAGASAAHNTSPIEDFRYTKLVARCGLAFALGVP